MATRPDSREARDAKIDALHEQLTGAVERLITGADLARSEAASLYREVRDLIAEDAARRQEATRFTIDR